MPRNKVRTKLISVVHPEEGLCLRVMALAAEEEVDTRGIMNKVVGMEEWVEVVGTKIEIRNDLDIKPSRGEVSIEDVLLKKNKRREKPIQTPLHFCASVSSSFRRGPERIHPQRSSMYTGKSSHTESRANVFNEKI